jgi:type IV pilus assembly protein PilC
MDELETHRVQAVADFSRELARWLDDGQPLGRAIGHLSQEQEPDLKWALEYVSTQVSSGALVSEQLASYPRYFDPLYLGLIRSGESNGDLANAFRSAADLLESDLSIDAALKAALAYDRFAALAVAGVALGIAGAIAAAKLLKKR